jgi:hypothetical protein
MNQRKCNRLDGLYKPTAQYASHLEAMFSNYVGDVEISLTTFLTTNPSV